jgi:ribosomal protein L11 methyltransferase
VVISPPWHDYTPERPEDVLVVLDPGMAFGTGTHPSTRLCLTALEDVLRHGDTVFDVGTGTGVLAIAAAKLGASHIDAVDIEPVAVRATIDNAERNGVGERITVAEGSADKGSDLLGSYDVVLANIISRILIEISPDLRHAVKPGGSLILSGVIEAREPFVREAFEPYGFRLRSREQIDDWVGLVYHLPAG